VFFGALIFVIVYRLACWQQFVWRLNRHPRRNPKHRDLSHDPPVNPSWAWRRG
jgi:hypothetical protein